MLVGSLIGDAAGGPVEFAPPEKVAGLLPGYRDRPDVRPEVRLGEEDFRRLAETFPLHAYDPIRPAAEPYGPWSEHAPAGTATDDTRNKIVLIDALRITQRRGARAIGRRDLAEAYLRFGDRPEVRGRPGWPALCDAGFHEFLLASRWVGGERDPLTALPPTRLWNGVGTCCGQMTLPPLAAVYPGEPARAYRAAYDLAFIDNGDAKDLNAAIVAGLAFALAQPVPGDGAAPQPAQRLAAWRAVLDAMRRTDPLRHADVPFMGRELDRWVEAGRAAAAGAGGSPAELYRRIDAACPHRYGWEANFLLVEAVALGEFTGGEPLAAMHLALDYGADTDSAAQLLGALFGAIHGPEIFPAAMRRAVEARLEADYGESLGEWAGVLRAARSAAR